MRGLYLITNDDPLAVLKQKLTLALQTVPVALVQYRRKQVAASAHADEVAQLLTLCQHYHVPLIINDDLSLAQQFACGLHLGQGDGSIQAAREVLGEAAIIGRTCHNSIELAQQAVHEGASYVALGAVYPSGSKPLAKSVSLGVLQQARQHLNVPICVIGGLTVENSAPLVALGLDLFAVIGDIFNRSDTELTTRLQAWQALINNASSVHKLNANVFKMNN